MIETDSVKTKAKAYQRTKQRLALFDLARTPVLLAMLLLFPISKALAQQVNELSFRPAAIAVYFLGFSLYFLIFDLPLAFYSGYLLEKKYELSNQTLKAWCFDFAKKSVLGFVISLLLVEALFACLHFAGPAWWLWAWAGFALFSLGVGRLFPVLIVPLFYKYGVVPNETLKERIHALARKFELPVSHIYSLNLSKTTKKANAAFMGMGKTRRVVLSDTLLAQFNDDEIETVVAHELGHYKHGDLWRGFGLGLVVSGALFWGTAQAVKNLWPALGFQGAEDLASFPLLALCLMLLGLAATPLQNAFSRTRETQADLFALRACANTPAFKSCMQKLGQVNLADPEPHPLYEWFFYDHPSIAKRVAFAARYEAEQSHAV